MAYIHQTPGRLRVRSLAVKQDPECVTALEAMLRCRPGVTSATVTAVTGSILILYAEDAVKGSALLETLREWGFLQAGTSPERRPAANL